MKFLPNTVINFHEIYDKLWIRDIIIFLKKHYNIISLEELEKFYYENKPLKNACHITFDDGDDSFYKIVFPILKRYQVPVSIYVSPLATKNKTNFWFQEIQNFDQIELKKVYSKVTKTSFDKIKNIPLNALLKDLVIDEIWEIIKVYRENNKSPVNSGMNMTQEQLLELDKSGLVSIGAHTQNHPILKNESDEKSFREISCSIKELSDILGKKITYFSYPNGIPNVEFGKREIDTLKEFGIKLAFSTEHKAINKNDDIYSIPRNGLSKGNIGFVFLKLLLGSKWVNLKKLLKGKQENDFRGM